LKKNGTPAPAHRSRIPRTQSGFIGLAPGPDGQVEVPLIARGVHDEEVEDANRAVVLP